MSKTVSLIAFFEQWRHRSPSRSEWTLLLSNNERGSSGVPVLVWPLLVAAVLAVSSAATVFKMMDEVPAITLAAWRLQLTSLLLLIGAVHQWRGMDSDAHNESWRSWPILTGSGLCLALHFGAWVWGLQHTSLAHSLLFVSSTPILLVCLAWCLGQPVTKMESSGALLGAAGGLVLALGAIGASGSQEAGLAGNVSSLVAAMAMVGYLSAGKKLRSWMPIFVYAFPVTAAAAAALSFLALVLHGGSAGGILGWLFNETYLLRVLYLAVGPGLVGHTGFNLLLKYMSPLTISLAFQMEPLVGSIIGWFFGVMSAPGASTYIGGAMVFVAACLVSIFGAIREAPR